MAKKPTHTVHKYQRVSWGKNGTIVWKCILTGCSHYTHVAFIEGKRSLCECGQPFVLTKDKLRRKNPRCDKCQRTQDPVFNKLDNLLEGLG